VVAQEQSAVDQLVEALLEAGLSRDAIRLQPLLNP